MTTTALEQPQTTSKDSHRPCIDAICKMENIGLRMGNVLKALENDIGDVIDSQAGEALREPLVQIAGLVQVLFDYQAQLSDCGTAFWKSQPENLFPA